MSAPSRRALRPSGALALATLLGVSMFLLGAADPRGQGASLAGTVRLLDGRKDDTRTEHRSALVWYRPDTPVRTDPPAEPFDMTTVRKEFQPRVLAVPLGSTVRFPNQDPILHNVFSISGKNRFDLGLYRGGDAKSTTFQEAGVVRVFCNVHHSMVAYVAVLDTPYYGRIDRDGAFRLDGLPPGSGELTVWHERSDPKTVRIDVPHRGPVRVDLELTKPKVPRHRNKFGKPYERTRRGKAY